MLPRGKRLLASRKFRYLDVRSTPDAPSHAKLPTGVEADRVSGAQPRWPSSRSTTSTTRALDGLAAVLARRLDHHAHDRLGARTAAPAPALVPPAPSTRASTASQTAARTSPARRDPRRGRSPSTCGSFASRPRPRAARRRAPAAGAAPRRCRRRTGVRRMSTMWPDCSPPSIQPRRTSSSTTCLSPTSVVATSMPASPIAWWKPKFVITVTATPSPAARRGASGRSATGR